MRKPKISKEIMGNNNTLRVSEYACHIIFFAPQEIDECNFRQAVTKHPTGFSYVDYASKKLVTNMVVDRMVAVEDSTFDAANDLISYAEKTLSYLPDDFWLSEIGPDLVSIEEVTDMLALSTQELIRIGLPEPVKGNLYQVSEVYQILQGDGRVPTKGQAKNWLEGGLVAREINAWLIAGAVDPFTAKVLDMTSERLA